MRMLTPSLVLLLATAASAQVPPPPPAAPLVVRAGAADATVKFSVFCDIEVEACQRLVIVLGRVIETYPDKVDVVFRHRANEGHEQAAAAYRAALAAARQGKGWAFLDMACANPDRLADGGLFSMARQLQLDEKQFALDTAADDVLQALDDDIAAAADQKVDTLPAVFLNGKRVGGPLTFDALEAAVTAAIK